MEKSGLRAPVSIEWLVEAAGEEKTLQFIEAAAGQRVSIPRKAKNSILANIYGFEIVEALVENMGGQTYQVPMVKAWRARMLARMGLTNNEIAVRLGTTWRTVNNILATDPYKKNRKPVSKKHPVYIYNQADLFH